MHLGGEYDLLSPPDCAGLPAAFPPVELKETGVTKQVLLDIPVGPVGRVTVDCRTVSLVSLED